MTTESALYLFDTPVTSTDNLGDASHLRRTSSLREAFMYLDTVEDCNVMPGWMRVEYKADLIDPDTLQGDLQEILDVVTEDDAEIFPYRGEGRPTITYVPQVHSPNEGK